MGSGSFSTLSYRSNSNQMNYSDSSIKTIFKNTAVDSGMSPRNISMVECKDTTEHPKTTPIIIAVDVTGSMGKIPHAIIVDGLPYIMDVLYSANISDPEILFLAIGDHKCDRYPIQIGQFESDGELLRKWLSSTVIEGGGGGNGGESYFLSWIVGAYLTSIDSINNRNTKGFLFTIGDEYVHTDIISGYDQFPKLDSGDCARTIGDLYAEVSKKYNTYHINIVQNSSKYSADLITNSWRNIVGENLIVLSDFSDVSKVISETIVSYAVNNNIVKTDVAIDQSDIAVTQSYNSIDTTATIIDVISDDLILL